MQFALTYVQHERDDQWPLRVGFRTDDGELREVACRGQTLGTFAQFRAMVANDLGIWLESRYHPVRRQAQAAWERDVAVAFDTGSAMGKRQAVKE